MVYNLKYNATLDRYKLEHAETKYTKFKEALDTITIADPGDIKAFIKTLEDRIKEGKTMGKPPPPELPPVVEPQIEVLDESPEDEEDEYLYEEGEMDEDE